MYMLILFDLSFILVTSTHASIVRLSFRLVLLVIPIHIHTLFDSSCILVLPVTPIDVPMMIDLNSNQDEKAMHHTYPPWWPLHGLCFNGR